MCFIKGQPQGRSSVSASQPPSEILVLPALGLTLQVHPTQHHHPLWPPLWPPKWRGEPTYMPDTAGVLPQIETPFLLLEIQFPHV